MASMRASGRGNRQIRTYGRAAGVLTNEGGVGTHPEDKGERVSVRIREDGAAATAATVAAGGRGVLGCVRDTRRLVSAHRALDTLSAGSSQLT